MLSHAYKVTFNLGPATRGEEDEAFIWIRRSSPVAKYLTAIELSYRDGWSVECSMPMDMGAHQMSELLFHTYKLISQKPWRPCLPAKST